MKWNWEQADWPEFSYQKDVMKPMEQEFLGRSGFLLGAFKHLDDDDKTALRVELLSEEALRTSEIEGEYLNRESIQSSISRHFGLQADRSRSRPAEHGIAEMMIDVYETWDEPLSHEMMCRWQAMLASGRQDLEDVGRYRSHAEPMRVVSGSIHEPRVHFVAPPSEQIPRDMDIFVEWFNGSAPSNKRHLSALTRAGLAHLHFESIHPFEDGNGRVGRALAEKSLAQSLGHPTLIALARAINERRKEYYDALEQNNKSLEITNWLTYFSNTVLTAQASTLRQVEFVIAKGRFLHRFENQLNPRQRKTLLRMLQEGPDGFRGGLSAANYIRITGASTATTTRDLQDLVSKGALTRSGERKHTRYALNMETR